VTQLEYGIWYLANELRWAYSDIMNMPVSRRLRFIEKQDFRNREANRQRERK
jgi:hypothetical protein